MVPRGLPALGIGQQRGSLRRPGAQDRMGDPRKSPRGARHDPSHRAPVLYATDCRTSGDLGVTAGAPQWEPNEAPSHYLCAGTLEEGFRAATERWAQRVSRAGADVVHRTWVSGHDPVMWDGELPAALTYAFWAPDRRARLRRRLTAERRGKGPQSDRRPSRRKLAYRSPRVALPPRRWTRSPPTPPSPTSSSRRLPPRPQPPRSIRELVPSVHVTPPARRQGVASL